MTKEFIRIGELLSKWSLSDFKKLHGKEAKKQFIAWINK